MLALSDAATPDASLLTSSVHPVRPRPHGVLRYLAPGRGPSRSWSSFVGSQFLTEILLRNPDYLEKLTNHKRLAEFKSRQQFTAEAREVAAGRKNRSQARRAARHTLGAIANRCVRRVRAARLEIGHRAAFAAGRQPDASLPVDPGPESDPLTAGFSVVAMGKLGGAELNYSSDIDLIFLCTQDASRFWTLGQRLIKALTDSTGEGFLYRVDMRAKALGPLGALVNTVDGHVSYLKAHGMLWERQALLKARVVAGDPTVGEEFLTRVEPLLFARRSNKSARPSAV